MKDRIEMLLPVIAARRVQRILRRIGNPTVQDLDGRMLCAAPLEVREVQEADGKRRSRHTPFPFHAIEIVRALRQQRIGVRRLPPDDDLLHHLVLLLPAQGTREQKLSCIFFRLLQFIHPMPCVEGHIRAQSPKHGTARLRSVLRNEELIGVDRHDDVGATLVKRPVHQRRHDLVVAKLRRLVALDTNGKPLRSKGAQDIRRAVDRRMIDHEHLVRIRQGVAHETLDNVGTVCNQGYSDDLVHAAPYLLMKMQLESIVATSSVSMPTAVISSAKGPSLHGTRLAATRVIRSATV